MKKLPLFLALDIDGQEQALDIVRKSKNYVQAYKIGPRLFLKHGVSLIEKIKEVTSCQIFLDLKFHDIPSSVLEALKSAFYIGVDYATVHATVGEEALKLLSNWERKIKKKRFFQILFVTVLSSIESSKKTEEKVLKLADQVYQAGLRGLVCSSYEVQLLRKKYKNMFLVTPGIRLEGDSKDDQKRVMSPEEALRAGSSALVMGRSLLRVSQLEKTLKNLSEKLIQ